MNAALDLLLDIGSLYGPAAPFIAIFRRAEPFLEAGMPLIKAAISEGPGAIEAAKQNAPELFKEIGNIASLLKAQAAAWGDAPTANVTDGEIIALAAHIAGVDPPGWLHEETVRWWDRASAQSFS